MPDPTQPPTTATPGVSNTPAGQPAGEPPQTMAVNEPATPPIVVTGGPVTDPNAAPRPNSNQDYYFQRQAEKARKEADEATKKANDLAQKLADKDQADLSEAERKERELAAANAKATKAEKGNARLQAIMEAELPKELADLVPEGIDNPKEYIESKVLPLKDRLAAPTAFGQATQPGRQNIPNEAQQIIDRFNTITDPKAKQAYYNEHHDVLNAGLPDGMQDMVARAKRI